MASLPIRAQLGFRPDGHSVVGRFVLLLLLFAFSSFLYGSPSGEARSVVIVVNLNDPGSREIADYYASRRGIPTKNIIELSTSTEETISLSQYVSEIHNPLLVALKEKGFINGVEARSPDRYGRKRLSVAVHSVSYLVTTRGVPLRIDNDPSQLDGAATAPDVPANFNVNRGSVDSELALLVAPPDTSMLAFVPNPLFGKRPGLDPSAARVLRVSRLDGPSVDTVKRLVDRSIEAELTGLAGRAYIDLGGPHEEGDQWIQAVGDLVQAAYFDVDIEKSKRLIGYPDRLDAPAIYVGWYGRHAYGPWRESDRSVPPGAIAYHLHSYSATTVRSVKSAWLGPLVEQGYCATFGYVFEPYLQLTNRPDLFIQALLTGSNFGQAVAYSQPVMSWQSVAIGDPLYQPFKVSLEDQLKNGEGTFAVYAILRELNRLQQTEGVETAIAYAQAQFSTFPALPLAFRLAELYEAAGEPAKAIQALRVLHYINFVEPEEAILVKQMADFLDRHGESAMATEVYEKLIGREGLPDALRRVLLQSGIKVAKRAGDSKLENAWSADLLQFEAK